MSTKGDKCRHFLQCSLLSTFVGFCRLFGLLRATFVDFPWRLAPDRSSLFVRGLRRRARAQSARYAPSARCFRCWFTKFKEHARRTRYAPPVIVHEVKL